MQTFLTYFTESAPELFAVEKDCIYFLTQGQAKMHQDASLSQGAV